MNSNESYELLFLNRLVEGEKLTEDELSDLIWAYEVERQEGEKRRWTQPITSIIQLDDRYFSIKWEEGLTEYQDNYFPNQPIEVKKITYEKVITVVEWKSLSEGI